MPNKNKTKTKKKKSHYSKEVEFQNVVIGF